MSEIESAVSRHASSNTSRLAIIYRKDEKTISNWIQRYNDTGTYSRKKTSTMRTFTEQEKNWIITHYQAHPLTFLDEAREAFSKTFHKSISTSHMWTIIHQFG
ncbi:unnamed protein product, partial [Aphanomyces euteiches]